MFAKNKLIQTTLIMTYTIDNSSPTNRGFRKANAYGMLGTFASCLLLFLIMWFYVMPYTPTVQPVEEEGLMISFGDSETGGGQGEELMGVPNPDPKAGSNQTATAPPASAPTNPVTQASNSKTADRNFVSGNEASEVTAEKARQEKVRKEQIAVENARIANEKRIADQKHREQDAVNKANSAMSGLFGNSKSAGNGNGTGTGSGEGPGRQGNPAGQGYAGGHSWSLNGRSLTSMAQPSYDKNIEGKITVNIRVDESGKVVGTTIGSPTTISDSEMRSAAMSAASRARFSSGNGSAAGSITYNFKLK